jgi:hypothetical protein
MNGTVPVRNSCSPCHRNASWRKPSCAFGGGVRVGAVLGALVSKPLVGAPAEDVGPSNAMTAPFSAAIPVTCDVAAEAGRAVRLQVRPCTPTHQVTREAVGGYHRQALPTAAVSHAGAQRRGAVAGTSRQSRACSRRAMAPWLPWGGKHKAIRRGVEGASGQGRPWREALRRQGRDRCPPSGAPSGGAGRRRSERPGRRRRRCGRR